MFALTDEASIAIQGFQGDATNFVKRLKQRLEVCPLSGRTGRADEAEHGAKMMWSEQKADRSCGQKDLERVSNASGLGGGVRSGEDGVATVVGQRLGAEAVRGGAATPAHPSQHQLRHVRP